MNSKVGENWPDEQIETDLKRLHFMMNLLYSNLTSAYITALITQLAGLGMTIDRVEHMISDVMCSVA